MAAGAWSLRYGRLSWEQVSASNYELVGPLSHTMQRALTWYCHHLQYELSYESLTCTHENTNDQNKKRPTLLHWDEPATPTATPDRKFILLSLVLAVLLVAVSGSVVCCGVTYLLVVGYKKMSQSNQKYQALGKECENSMKEVLTKTYPL